MPVRYLLAALACWLFPGVSHAQENSPRLKLSGSVRLRYEMISGQARTGLDIDDTLANVRTQLLAEYDAHPFTIATEIFDSRAYGADPGTPLSTNEVNALELVQVYVGVDAGDTLGADTKLSLTAGRMTLNLGSRRLVAADDYRNTTNGYTGLRADFASDSGLRATVIYTLPQVRLPDGDSDLRQNAVKLDRESFDLVLWGGLASKTHIFESAMAEISFFHLSEHDTPSRPTRDRSLNSVGARFLVEPKDGKIDYEVEAIWQSGQTSSSMAADAVTLPVSASFIHADVGYSWNGPWRPHVSVEFDRASGDGGGRHYGRFDTLFGMRRAELAPAGLYNAIGRTNILTPGVRLEVSPGTQLDSFIVYRAMWLASRSDSFSTTGVRDAAGRSGSFAGHQIEGRIRYWLIPKMLRFEFDGVFLAKGHFLRSAPNAPTGRSTRYASFNLTAGF